MTNRDVVMSLDVQWQDDGSILCLSQSTTHEKYPENKDYIRMEMLKLSHFKQDGDGIAGQEFTNMDFKGYFPIKMLNMIIAATASKGIEEFAKRVKTASRD